MYRIGLLLKLFHCSTKSDILKTLALGYQWLVSKLKFAYKDWATLSAVFWFSNNVILSGSANKEESYADLKWQSGDRFARKLGKMPCD